MGELRIWLLGGFRVRVGEREVPDESWRLRKARTLVKLLALAPGRRMHREMLIDQLWPDLSPEAADNQLRKALHEARRALDPDPDATFAHIVSGPPLGLVRGTWVDLDAFEDAGEARRRRDPVYERAVASTAGTCYPRTGTRTGPTSAGSRARRLRGAARRMGAAARGAGRPRPRDRRAPPCGGPRPVQENARAGLIRLHALAGRRQEALREYEELRTTLRDELGTDPTASSQHLYEQIRMGQALGGDLDTELWEQVGDLRLLSGDAASAAVAFEHAVRTARSPRSPADSARLHRKAAQAWLTDQHPEPAARHLHAAQALTARTSGDELARRLAVEATWLCQTGRYGPAQDAAEAALRTARTSGAPDALAFAHETLAIVLHIRGAWREGVHAEMSGSRSGSRRTRGWPPCRRSTAASGSTTSTGTDCPTAWRTTPAERWTWRPPTGRAVLRRSRGACSANRSCCRAAGTSRMPVCSGVRSCMRSSGPDRAACRGSASPSPRSAEATAKRRSRACAGRWPSPRSRRSRTTSGEGCSASPRWMPRSATTHRG